MRRLYVCGSFKFTRDIKRLERELKEGGVKYQTSKKAKSRGIRECLKKIDRADIVYVVNPEGYVGKSVAVDIGYAYARNKSLYVMQQVEDPPVMDLIDGVLSPAELLDFVKKKETETSIRNSRC